MTITPRRAAAVVRRAGEELIAFGMVARAGAVGPLPPHGLAEAKRAVERWGPVGSMPSIAALRFGERAAVVDERGTVSFAELERRSNALASAWREWGVQAGDGVAIMCRNHGALLEAAFAAAKTGARIIPLVADYAGPQLRDVSARERVRMLVYDDELEPAAAAVDVAEARFRAFGDPNASDSIDALIDAHRGEAPPAAAQAATIVLMTSGTTGAPKGAPRAHPRSFVPVGALLARVPFRARESVALCAPMFHGLGLGSAFLAVSQGSTLHLRRRFDAAAVLDAIERRRIRAAVAVPVMLRRMLDDDDERRRDLSSLRVVLVGGSLLGAALATRALERLGDVLYNLYGSTEVAYAAMATPADLRVSPLCVGKPMRGAVVRVLDDHGRPAPTGTSGRIFVANRMQFDGYTGGGGKQVIDGLMCSGDVGHFDADGRLYVDGRDDEMIVSGGENVFPAEVEDLLSGHDAVAEAAAIGVPDEDWGQRLRAFVALRPGAELSADEIRSYVRAHLARYKVPRDVVFVEALPRTPTGKVIKRQLGDLNGASPA